METNGPDNRSAFEQAADPALLARLHRRRALPLGVVDVARARAHFERLSEWLSARGALTARLLARAARDTEEAAGEDTDTLLRHAAAGVMAQATPTAAAVTSQAMSAHEPALSSSKPALYRVKRGGSGAAAIALSQAESLPPAVPARSSETLRVTEARAPGGAVPGSDAAGTLIAARPATQVEPPRAREIRAPARVQRDPSNEELRTSRVHARAAPPEAAAPEPIPARGERAAHARRHGSALPAGNLSPAREIRPAVSEGGTLTLPVPARAANSPATMGRDAESMASATGGRAYRGRAQAVHGIAPISALHAPELAAIAHPGVVPVAAPTPSRAAGAPAPALTRVDIGQIAERVSRILERRAEVALERKGGRRWR
jgi:hypothetical protein